MDIARWRCAYRAYGFSLNNSEKTVGRVRRSRHPAFFIRTR
ncbi:hypothetical protein AC520_3040 [Enterobacter sp. OLF]|nr:hypothetical protein AC520_4224 [Enterobacter sp. OLF]PUB50625.1 hypothetical protein AC520_3040 [Enterobacter sp. OLF]